MADTIPPLKKLAPLLDPLKLAQAATQTPQEKIDCMPSFQGSRAAPVGPAARRELPQTLLRLEPQPLSAYDDNPVFGEVSAAYLLGVTADCLKKWRQRRQGPDYIQYGRNGPVRYELNALMDFRDKHRVIHSRGK